MHLLNILMALVLVFWKKGQRATLWYDTATRKWRSIFKERLCSAYAKRRDISQVWMKPRGWHIDSSVRRLTYLSPSFISHTAFMISSKRDEEEKMQSSRQFPDTEEGDLDGDDALASCQEIANNLALISLFRRGQATSSWLFPCRFCQDCLNWARKGVQLPISPRRV